VWSRGVIAVLLLSGCKVEAGASVHAGSDGAAGAEGHADASRDSGDGSVQWRRCGDELVFENGEINFATGSHELEGDRTQQTLLSLARFLREHPEVDLDVEGHTDSRGGDAYNRKLSDGRARALRDWLIEHGIDKARLVSHGYGKDRPRVAEPAECRGNPSGPAWCEDRYWRHNRRTEFHVTKGMETIPEQCAKGSALGPDALHCDVDAAQPGLWPGFYLYLAPGVLAAPLGSPADTRGTGYQWGLGLGYAWRPGARQRGFVALGLGLEHATYRFDDAASGVRSRAHDLRVMPELRVGGGSRRIVGYGMLTPGLGLGFGGVDGTTAGFALGVGAGLWGHVWRGLFLGAEVGVDPVFYVNGDTPHDGATVSLDVRALIGWHFGWRPR
jgi:outer membrane protein OmpA-like peptidoglycan-associated protein